MNKFFFRYFGLLAGILFYSLGPLLAQKTLYNLVSSDGKMGIETIDKFKLLLNKELNAEYNRNAISKISITCRSTNGGMIEGIDTRSISKSTMLVRMVNTVTGKDTSISFQYEIVTENAHSIGDAILNKFSSKNADVMMFKKAFNDFYKDKTDCLAITAKLKQMRIDHQYEELLRKIVRLEQNAICNSELSGLKQEVLREYGAEQCEKKLYDAKVLIANGSSQALNQATTLLRSIPPSKECRDQAMQVIQELSNVGNLNESSKRKVNNLGLMWTNIDINNWMIQLIED
ncbi:MAG: hypothetical protein ABI851_12585 [Saprospiraceae bacterium]